MGCNHCRGTGLVFARNKFKAASEYVFRCWCDLGVTNPDSSTCRANKHSSIPRWESGREEKYIPSHKYGSDDDVFWGVWRTLPEIPNPKGLDEHFGVLEEGSIAHRAIKHKYKDNDLRKIYKDWKEWSENAKLEEVGDQNETTNTSSNGGVHTS